MNVECHIWVSVCVVLTSTRHKNAQLLHLKEFDCNIETTTQARNKNNLSRVYLLQNILNITYVPNMFACFQLYIEHPFPFENNSNLDFISSVVKLIVRKWF